MSEADDVVSDVHGGVAGLVDEGALVQSSEDLETQQTESQHEVGRTGPSGPLVTADNVERLRDLIRNLNIDIDVRQTVSGVVLVSPWFDLCNNKEPSEAALGHRHY